MSRAVRLTCRLIGHDWTIIVGRDRLPGEWGINRRCHRCGAVQ